MRNFDKMIDQRKKNSESIESRIRNPRDDICRDLENLNIKCEEKEESSAALIFKCEVNDVEKESQKLENKTHENKENYCSNDSDDETHTCTTLHRSENVEEKEEVSEGSVLHNGGEPHAPGNDYTPVILEVNKNANETRIKHTEKGCVQKLLNIRTLTKSEEKSCSTDRNVNKTGDREASKSESGEEKNSSEEKILEDAVAEEAFLRFEKLNIKETKEEEEERSDESDENQDTSESRENDLCSRGPIHNQNNRNRGSHAPYLFSQSRQCGGMVEVQDNWIPTTNYEPNIKLNISTEDQNHNPVPLLRPSVPKSVGNDGVDSCSSQDLEKIKNMLEQYPCLNDIVDVVAKEWLGQNPSSNINIVPSRIDQNNWSSSQSCSGSTLKGSSGYSDDESNPTSPIGSPPVGFTSYNHPSPSGASISSSSGVSTSKGSPQYINECFNDTSTESYAAIWVQKVAQTLRPLVPKPPPTNVDPNSYRSKLMKKLDDDRRLIAWARVHACKIDDLCAGDKDGDTNLMIFVTNKQDSKKEYIYAMVERMRHIPGALSQKNVAGHSALYMASIEMCEEPIVAAYIAEALVEQNVDIAEETYNGLTLPQILQRKGDPYKGVLRELLQLKNHSGQLVFHSFLNNGYVKIQ